MRSLALLLSCAAVLAAGCSKEPESTPVAAPKKPAVAQVADHDEHSYAEPQKVAIADLALDITPSFFMQAMPGAVKVANLTLAVSKSVVFGVLIALVGCHYGLRVEPNTQSLGRGTTASVVAAITVVILVDAVFAIVFRSVGV